MNVYNIRMKTKECARSLAPDRVRVSLECNLNKHFWNWFGSGGSSWMLGKCSFCCISRYFLWFLIFRSKFNCNENGFIFLLSMLCGSSCFSSVLASVCIYSFEYRKKGWVFRFSILIEIFVEKPSQHLKLDLELWIHWIAKQRFDRILQVKSMFVRHKCNYVQYAYFQVSQS